MRKKVQNNITRLWPKVVSHKKGAKLATALFLDRRCLHSKGSKSIFCTTFSASNWGDDNERGTKVNNNFENWLNLRAVQHSKSINYLELHLLSYQCLEYYEYF